MTVDAGGHGRSAGWTRRNHAAAHPTWDSGRAARGAAEAPAAVRAPAGDVPRAGGRAGHQARVRRMMSRQNARRTPRPVREKRSIQSERAVVHLAAHGISRSAQIFLQTSLSAPEIARELYLSVNTVRTHMRHLYDKLGAHRRLEAIDRARTLGLLAPAPQRA